jgi:hypothetical protein
MKNPLTKREIALAIATAASLLLVVVTGIYAANLHTKNLSDDILIKGKDVLLEDKDTQSNESANYTDTICAEYRKLYQAYTSLRSQHPSTSGRDYALPGSAKGEVDECYQPE